MKKRADGYYRKQITYEIDGNKVKKSFYYKNDKDLIEKIKAFESQLIVRESHLFETVADEWKEEHFNFIQPGTQISYTPALNRAKEEFNGIPVSDIRPLDIQRFIDKTSRKGFSQQTVHVQRNVLNLIFKYAVLQDYIEYNPVEPTRIPRHLPKQKRELPDENELKKVRESKDKDFGLFAYLLLLTGCRRGEALALQWKDLDLENRIIHITKQITYNGENQNRPILTEHTKTEAGMRDVFIPDLLFEMLSPGKPDEFLFGGKEPLTKTQFNKRWARYKKEADVSFTPHQLRHAYATYLFESNVPVKDAQSIMGHSSVKVTQDIYTHIQESHRKETQNKLNSYLNKTLS